MVPFLDPRFVVCTSDHFCCGAFLLLRSALCKSCATIDFIEEIPSTDLQAPARPAELCNEHMAHILPLHDIFVFRKTFL